MGPQEWLTWLRRTSRSSGPLRAGTELGQPANEVSPRHGPDQGGVPVHVERPHGGSDRKSTRLNSSHVSISYAVFCLKKKFLQCLNQKLHNTHKFYIIHID